MGLYIKSGITKKQFDSFTKQRNGLNKPVIIHALPENVMFVPDHGDLMDKDKFYIDLMDRGVDHVQTDDYTEICQAVFNAPIVIPAERSDE